LASEQELREIESPGAKVTILEQAILKIIAAGAKKPRLQSRPIAMDILEARGMVRVSELSQRHRVQVRSLERIFLEEIGVTAKVFSRIVRFNHAKKMIETNPDIDLLTLTYECGYADQPHFTRNFREMFGITPSEFKARLKDLFKSFQEKKPDVVFLQDTAVQAD
jgi:AraC-like DNA-binding protein